VRSFLNKICCFPHPHNSSQDSERPKILHLNIKICSWSKAFEVKRRWGHHVAISPLSGKLQIFDSKVDILESPVSSLNYFIACALFFFVLLNSNEILFLVL
jgi:hypothetical protein